MEPGLLSIAPFFQPFDILLDVGVCLRCSSDTYCSLFQREKERGREGDREGGKQEAPDGRFALPGRVAEEVIKQPFHLRLLG